MKKGFTLAEVLITLAIIGVVAAITLPTLMQDGRKQQLGAKLGKFQSNIEKITRGYALEEDLTVGTVREALEQELLFKGSHDLSAEGWSNELRDGTRFSLYTGGTPSMMDDSNDSKIGTFAAAMMFRPEIPGLTGQTNFEFVVTTKGYVVPMAGDQCLKKIAQKNYKASSVYNDTNCPKRPEKDW